MKIGFAIITGLPFFAQVIETEHRFHEEAHFFDLLGEAHNLPHITLFQGEMDDRIDYGSIAESIAARMKELIPEREIAFSNMAYVPEGWYFLECRKTKELQELHDFTLKSVEPYIVLEKDRMSRELNELPENQIDALRKYGYRYSGTAFYPHITIGRAKERDDLLLKKLNNAFDEIGKDTVADRITVYKMGNNGTHERTLYEVKL